MEYLHGCTLKQYIREHGGRMDTDHILHICLSVLDALAVVHKAGMIHRDISPDNIMINTSGKGTLIDYGNVRSAGELSDNEELAIYKRYYYAYEQLEKHGQRGPWKDVYGLCATI